MSRVSATATAPSTPTDQRTRTFTSSVTGQPVTFTCMQGCTLNHRGDTDTPTHPVDVYCWSDDNDSETSLPVDPNTGTPENFQILSSRITVEPFSANIARRLPHAVVEILDEHYIAPLDPDALASLIGLLASRVDALRLTHAELVRTRAEYVARAARIEGHVDQILDALRETRAEATA